MRNWIAVAAVCWLGLMLSGCGDDGEAGPPGPPGTPTVDEASALAVTFESVSVNAEEHLTVAFSVTDERGNAFRPLAGSPSFTVAKLLPGSDGEASRWQSFINRTEAPNPELGPGTETVVQATTENSGTFEELGGGRYRYTFEADLLNAKDPLSDEPIDWDAGLTHRLGVQISGSDRYPAANAVFDWVPNGDTVSMTRQIVATDSCNVCHHKLALHGGNRIDTQYCVTCHNPGSTDAISANTVDFKVMVHKIHMGRLLPGIAAGGDGSKYSIFGFADREHLYAQNSGGEVSGVGFPEDLRGCTTCHDEDNPDTPDAANWFLVPTAESCGSCHDDVNFVTGVGHPVGPASNEECGACHSPDGSIGAKAVHEQRVANQLSGRKALAISIDSVKPYDGTNVVVELSVTIDGQGVADFAALEPFLDPELDFSRYPAVAINFNPDGRGYVLRSLNRFALSDCQALGAGKFRCTIPQEDVQGTLLVTLVNFEICVNEQDDSGSLLACDTEENFTTRVGKLLAEVPRAFFTTAGAVDADYQEPVGVSQAGCNSCHQQKQVINHFTQQVGTCVGCHNVNRSGRSSGLPGDFKSYVHAKHSEHAEILGLDEIHFPGVLNNCEACHAEGQYDLPLARNNRPSAASPEGGEGNVYTSPTAVVCGSCHLTVGVGRIEPSLPGLGVAGEVEDEELAVLDHMIANGAIFGAASAAEADKVEGCAVCHAQGAEAGVDKVHRVADFRQ